MTLRWNLENLWSYKGWVGAEGSGVGMSALCWTGLSVLTEPRFVPTQRPLEFISCQGHSMTHFQMRKSFPIELAKYLE